jgi:plastocyanin
VRHFQCIAAATTLVASLQASVALAAAPYAGCKATDFVMVAGPTASVTIEGKNYVPRCLKVKTGTKVTLPGTSGHPLRSAPAIGGLANPFASAGTGFVVAQTRQLNVAGSYGYYCTRHGDEQTGADMGGHVLVVP